MNPSLFLSTFISPIPSATGATGIYWAYNWYPEIVNASALHRNIVWLYQFQSNYRRHLWSLSDWLDSSSNDSETSMEQSRSEIGCGAGYWPGHFTSIYKLTYFSHLYFLRKYKTINHNNLGITLEKTYKGHALAEKAGASHPCFY